jgi:transcriptional regulator with XRE-family HTH domain
MNTLDNTYDRKKFQELLRKGIGTRTQREFAAQLGVTAPQVNRMLMTAGARPRVKTLEKISQHMTNVSLSELMEACGYEVPDIQEKVDHFEGSIFAYFGFSIPENEKFFSAADMTEIADGIRAFFGDDSITVSIGESTECPDRDAGVEQETLFTVNWEWDTWVCETTFHVYHTKTASGKELVFGTDIGTKEPSDRENVIGHTHIKSKARKRAEERLLNSLFGGYDGGWYPVTFAGWGVDCTGMEESTFQDFLCAHASSYCTTPERAAGFRAYVSGEPMETAFDYGSDDHEDIMGLVLEEIFRMETGEDFEFYGKDPNVPEQEQNDCVMVRTYDEDIFRDGKDPELDRNLLVQLFNYAKELKLPSFGAVYYRAAARKRSSHIYKTDDFYFVERD